MIEQLFGSKTRVKLLQLFYQNPNRSFYVREITRKIDEQINSVRRELANLLSIGIITSDTNNNRLYYEVNQSFNHYIALSSIFSGKKVKLPKKNNEVKETVGEVTEQEPVTEQAIKDPFIQELMKVGNVRLALYTGQFTRDEMAGVDIVVVGDVNQAAVEHLVAELELAEKKQLRYSVFDKAEFIYRKQVNDRFVSNLVLAKKIIFTDKDKLL
ncbi:MAG TPA: transcriptional regulator [Patescibacteria group bacterium]|nr:transcriptional regulator [Patescibacteria group bacterium]